MKFHSNGSGEESPLLTITFFDLETTGKNPTLDEILTGYFKTIEYKRGFREKRIIDELYVEIKPIGKIGESSKIHGICEERAKDFKGKRETLGKIYKYLKGKRGFTCVHANGFIYGRKGYYDNTCLHNNYSLISDDAYFHFGSIRKNFQEISTHTIAKKIAGSEKNDLATLCKMYGIEQKDHHNCIDDVNVTIQIFEKLVTGMDLTDEDLFDLGNYDGEKTWSQNLTLI